MTFTPRDVRDVSALVAKKLELYMNVERRQERFDPLGCYRTTPKMQTLDLMYQMLNKAEIEESSTSPRESRTKASRKTAGSPVRKEKHAKKGKHGTRGTTNNHIDDSKTTRNSAPETEDAERKKVDKKERNSVIKPKLIENSRRVVPKKEAERITETVNKVFGEQDLDKLHVIHRYRPHSYDIAPITENGKVANYSMHVGSALHSKNYVEYYMKEGLQSGKKDHSKRLQRLKAKQEKEQGSNVADGEGPRQTN